MMTEKRIVENALREMREVLKAIDVVTPAGGRPNFRAADKLAVAIGYLESLLPRLKEPEPGPPQAHDDRSMRPCWTGD